MWHVRSRSGVATLRTAIQYTLVTYLPGYRPRRRLLIIVDSSVNWFACVRRGISLLVASRRTRVSRTCLRVECPGGKCPFPCSHIDTSVARWLERMHRRKNRLNFVMETRGPIYKISYDNLNLRLSYDNAKLLQSTYDGRLISKTSYEGRKAFLRYDSLAMS